MKVIVIMHNNLNRLATVSDDVTTNGIRLDGKTYTTNSDYIHKEPWNHAYMIYYNKNDYSSEVKNFHNFINHSKYNYAVYPMRGPIILVKSKHFRLLDCSRDDFKDIEIVHSGYCLLM